MTEEQRQPLNTTRRIRKLLLCTVLLLICSAVLNVIFATETRRQRALTASYKSKVLAIKAEQSLTLGAVVPPIEAKEMDGKVRIIEYASSALPTILYVFTPPCGWCAKNVPNVNTLSEKTKGRYRIIGLSLSGTGLGEYVSKHGLQFPIYTDPSPAVVLSYRLAGTPETFLVSNDGKLIREWKGAYIGINKKEIEEYFGVELPGLNQEPNK
jgi:peroxiredoxin